MLEQVIINLAVNARDAMASGGTLVISTAHRTIPDHSPDLHPEAKPGEFVCLSVADTGCGMDAATRRRAFEPFFTTKEPGKGTGLGLATVYGILKQHHGWIQVESEVGRGTTFDLYFPRAQNKNPLCPRRNRLKLRAGTRPFFWSKTSRTCGSWRGCFWRTSATRFGRRARGWKR